mgnify:CR=1 FL=1
MSGAGVDDVVERVVTPWTMYAAVYASGWVARRTVVPARFQGALALVLLAAPIAAAVALARRTDAFELTGGRCRAKKTTDGERCQLSRDAGEDLCHVHQDVHDVEVHPTALEDVDGTVDSDGTEPPSETETA